MRSNHKNHIGSLCGLSLLYVTQTSELCFIQFFNLHHPSHTHKTQGRIPRFFLSSVVHILIIHIEYVWAPGKVLRCGPHLPHPLAKNRDNEGKKYSLTNPRLQCLWFFPILPKLKLILLSFKYIYA